MNRFSNKLLSTRYLSISSLSDTLIPNNPNQNVRFFSYHFIALKECNIIYADVTYDNMISVLYALLSNMSNSEIDEYLDTFKVGDLPLKD